MDQIRLHKKIDILLLKNPDDIKQEEVFTLISENKDAKEYFYSKADERWLGCLWDNGFLDIIKEESKGPTRYKYATSELNYLVKISGEVPSKIVEIILDKNIATSSNNFNPEVIDRFLQICSGLSAKQLARLVRKIRDDKWVPLMESFNQLGFEYERMFKILISVKDYESILILAEAVLAVRTKEKMEKSTNRIITDNPFYFSNLSHTKVFKYLTLVDDEYIEQALRLSTKIMKEVILLGGKTKSSKVFPIEDTFPLLDVDFFTLESKQRNYSSYRDDVRELATVVKMLVSQLIDKKYDEADIVQKIYNQYIKSLPKNRAMWRLRLFVLSLYPKIFKAELKDAFFRLFEVKQHYYEIISGAEYEKALQKGFPELLKKDRREYIKKVIEYFTKKDKEKKSEKEDWHLKYGAQILSMIPDDQITEKEKQKAKKAGFELNPRYKPEPSVGKMRGGMVHHQSPINLSDFTIDQIIQKLKTNLTPQQLKEKYKGDDFLKPRGVEGLGDALKEDVKKRTAEYLKNICKFFDRKDIHPHYLYSILRGVQEVLHENKIDTNDINWDNLVALCIAIKDSGKAESFNRGRKIERDSFDARLIRWTEVHSAITDIIQELLNEKDGDISIDFSKYRNQLFGIIDYLLKYPDPTPEDEKLKTAQSKTKSAGDSDYLVTDPFTMAINTVRGRAFQAFVLFVYQDSKKFAKENDSKISIDVKELYEEVLKNENTRALMFMFGHYLPSFYFRDKKWIRSLLPQIFSTDSESKFLYLAAWEGYLASNLYENIFFDSIIQKLYERGIALTDTTYSEQKHFREPDEGIATHLTLAFMHYKKFGFEHPLFTAFWINSNSARHAKFVSFIGRSFISGDNARLNDFLKKEPWSKERLRDFWDWILKNYENKKPFIEFGFWISLEKDIFELVWLAKHVRKTLKKTNGALDSEYRLIKYIVQFAKEAPEDALAIARLYLFEGGVHEANHRISFHIDKEWSEAFKILYNNPKTKSGTYTLINDLIREGGSIFWNLKNVINSNYLKKEGEMINGKKN